MVEENSENRRRENNNNSKEVKVNVSRRDWMRIYFIIFNEYDLFL